MVDPKEIERRLNDATMHMHLGQLGRATAEARAVIELIQRMDGERHEFSFAVGGAE